MVQTITFMGESDVGVGFDDMIEEEFYQFNDCVSQIVFRSGSTMFAIGDKGKISCPKGVWNKDRFTRLKGLTITANFEKGR